MPVYKHLFFDLDNTLWDFDLNSWHALREVYNGYGLPDGAYQQFNEAYNRHNDRLWEEYRQHRITKQELASSRFNLTFGELGISGIDGAEFNRLYLEEMPVQTRLCDGVREILERLVFRYSLHIITNGFIEVQYKKLESSGLRRYFKNVFISEEIKYPKPSPEIFHHALKSSNARKRESLMIGDSWEVDVLGALRSGIDQVHYAPKSSCADFSAEEKQVISVSPTRTWRIGAMKELGVILRS
jgi:putative hydrolase of the HAD superfamily